MSDPVKVEFELIEAIPEIQLIGLMMDASKQFDDELTTDEKNRAMKYVNDWYEQMPKPL